MPDVKIVWKRLQETLHLMIGIPDYAAYVKHCAEKHPGKPVMSKAEFIDACQKRRFGGQASRCC